MYQTRIAGTGSYLPERVLTNFDLEKLVDTSDQWIRERTGIERRHMAAPGQTTSDLAYEASQRALKAANMSADDIDMIIFGTVTGDQLMPSTACYLQKKLGCAKTPAFDLAAACSGFVYSLTIAEHFIRAGTYKTILVVGAEVLHNFVNYKDRETCILFGDGAGAFVVTRAEKNDANVILSSHLMSVASLADLLVLPAGGSKQPITHEILDQGGHYMKMKGREIFKNAVQTMSACCEETLKQNNVKAEDISWLVPHQANFRIMEAVAERFGFPLEKVVNIVHEMGNTSAATIPVAFDTAVRDGRIKRGQLILLTTFGAGLTAGSMLLRY